MQILPHPRYLDDLYLPLLEETRSLFSGETESEGLKVGERRIAHGYN